MSILDQVRDVIRKKHYSIRTEQAYIEWIKRLGKWGCKAPWICYKKITKPNSYLRYSFG